MPKLTRLLSDANLIHTLELFCDKYGTYHVLDERSMLILVHRLPKTRLLPCFSYPNVLDSLPRRMEALRSLHFATAAGQLYVLIIRVGRQLMIILLPLIVCTSMSLQVSHAETSADLSTHNVLQR